MPASQEAFKKSSDTSKVKADGNVDGDKGMKSTSAGKCVSECNILYVIIYSFKEKGLTTNSNNIISDLKHT